MSIKFLFSKNVLKAWSDVYDSTDSITIHSGTSSRITFDSGCHYITKCTFESLCEKSGSGGAIYSSNNGNAKMFVEETTFTECHCSGFGGAIYFYSSGSCALAKVCGYKCSTTSSNSFQFDRVYVTDSGLTIINTINDSSIAYSLNDNNAHHTLYHRYGRIISCSVNVSNNKCSQTSGIYCYPSTSSSASSGDPSCIISFSTFTNNTCHTHYVCLYLHEGSAFKEINRCNVLRNTQQNTDTRGTICSNGNLDIKSSCILDNSAKYDFYANSYTITITDCTRDTNKETYGSVTIKETPAQSFINALIHTQAEHCVAQFDSVGDLTVITQQTKRTKACFTLFVFKNRAARDCFR